MTHLFELFRAPIGVDLERIHLLGDFTIDAIPEYSSAAGLVRLGKKFFIAPQKNVESTSDITSHGYPFYPGAVEYTATCQVTDHMLEADKIVFKIGEFNGCTSAVFVNGRHQGYIDKEPYSLCLDKEVLVAGQNEIKVRLLGSFRNMFGPSHFVDFDPSGCDRWTWHYDFEHTDVTEYDTEHLTNSFQLAPYGIGDLALLIHDYSK